jgi:hypothetical protein
MPLEHCLECNRAFDRTGASHICFNCLETERKDYQKYYKRVSPALNKLDYLLVGEQLKMDPKALREVLVFRLGNGEIQELSQQKKGQCYLCNFKYKNKDNIEPICMPCLRNISKVVEGRPGYAVSAQPEAPMVHFATRKPKEVHELEVELAETRAADRSTVRPQVAPSSMAALPPRPAVVAKAAPTPAVPVKEAPKPIGCANCGRPTGGGVCKPCFDQVNTELTWFRTQYGEISQEKREMLYREAGVPFGEAQDEAVAQALAKTGQSTESQQAEATPIHEGPESSDPVDDVPTVSASVTAPPVVAGAEENIEDFLKVLEMDEHDPSFYQDLHDPTIPLGEPDPEFDPTRKFGFKRVKFK